MMIDEKFSRRRLLKGALASLAACAGCHADRRPRQGRRGSVRKRSDCQVTRLCRRCQQGRCAGNPTYKPGQTCANCIQYTGAAGAAKGPCTIFPGKTVAAKGWCKVWVLKPGATPG